RIFSGAYLGPPRPDLSLQLRPTGWPAPAIPDPVAEVTPAGPNLTVHYFAQSAGLWWHPRNPTRTTINGRPAVLWHNLHPDPAVPSTPVAGIRIAGADFEIRVETTKWTPGFDATLRAVAESIELAPGLKDKSTWFDADVAIP
ncbi:MAG TPA: hypothetical protein VGJ44_02560, partial [Kribbellaceae bacterium]